MQCDEVLSIFPKEIRELVQSFHLSPDGLQEIRIRAGRPILIRYRNRELVTGRTVSRERTAEILAYLGSYSLYAYEAEQGGALRKGGDGSRAGENIGRDLLAEYPVRPSDQRLCGSADAVYMGRGETAAYIDCFPAGQRQDDSSTGLYPPDLRRL